MADNVSAASRKRRYPFIVTIMIRMVREKPLGAFGGVVILLLVLVSIFAGSLAPYDYSELHLEDRLSPASAKYLLGTDQLGRDFLSRLIHGGRTSLAVGLAATTVHVLIAVLVGTIAGFFGGIPDLIIQRIVDAWMSFPGLLLLLTIMSILGQGMLQTILVLGLTSGIANSRVVRGAVISIRQNDYFEAARAIGSTNMRTLLRHVLPNIMAPVIVIFSITIGATIVAESSLSFLGFGMPPEIPSWGSMLSREGRQYMEIAPWIAFWPGLALTVVVYSLNMFGDALRDLLDPRLKGGVGRLSSRNTKLAKKALNTFRADTTPESVSPHER